ncbi:MAG: HD domain-containing protein [Chloroflexi bacterium]|nr:HD domain-containing protein [Chloroflexota bacterium]
MKLNLLAKFSLVSLLLVATIGGVLGWGIEAELEQNAIQQEADNAASDVANILDPYLTPADLAAPLSAFRLNQIDTLVKRDLLRAHIVRIKIWKPDGFLQYSDDKKLVGQRFPVEGDLLSVLQGKMVVGISDLQAAENVEERGKFDKLLEMYIPLRLQGSQQVQGAYEVYNDLSALQPRIDSMRRFVWLTLLVGFLALYASLFTIVRDASRRLAHNAVENARLFMAAQQEIEERKQAEEHAQRQLHRLAALRRIDVAITSSPDLHGTLETILDQVITQLQVDAASVLLLSLGSEMLEYVVGRGFRSNEITSSRFFLGEGLAGRAALEHRMLHLDDLRTSDEFMRSELLAAEGFTSYYAVPLLAKGQVKGVLEIFSREPLQPDQEWRNFLEALAGQTAIALDNATLFEELERLGLDLAVAYDTTLEGWSRALDLRDKETEGHSRRVTGLTLQLARIMGVSEEDLVHLRWGSLLHDIGKMGIPDSILLKPGPLTDEEREIMRRHPSYAHKLLAPIEFLNPALDIPYCHHEWWDGSGYPRGLRGREIPLAARIFAVVDVWDALCSDRPYRPAWPEAKVREHIRSLAGTHFDPEVVEAFLAMDASAVAESDTVELVEACNCSDSGWRGVPPLTPKPPLP